MVRNLGVKWESLFNETCTWTVAACAVLPLNNRSKLNVTKNSVARINFRTFGIERSIDSFKELIVLICLYVAGGVLSSPHQRSNGMAD
jgi:hypothetical protein